MEFENLSLTTLIYVALVYFLGGLTQGVLGVGLITVVIALLSFVFDVKLTIALVLVPTLVTSFFQMINGGNLKKIIPDVRVYLIFSTTLIIPGVWLLKSLNSNLILVFIAIILFSNSALSLMNKKISIPSYQHPLSQSSMGSLNGFIIGLTSIYTMPFVFLLQSLQYPKEKAVQFMGLAFVLYSSMQLITFSSMQLIDWKTFIPSLLVTLPVVIGFFVGKKIRSYISETFFRKLFHLMLIIMSIVIILNVI
jgi:uncharacterized membrane protein YfcA